MGSITHLGKKWFDKEINLKEFANKFGKVLEIDRDNIATVWKGRILWIHCSWGEDITKCIKAKFYLCDPASHEVDEDELWEELEKALGV